MSDAEGLAAKTAPRTSCVTESVFAIRTVHGMEIVHTGP